MSEWTNVSWMAFAAGMSGKLPAKQLTAISASAACVLPLASEVTPLSEEEVRATVESVARTHALSMARATATEGSLRFTPFAEFMAVWGGVGVKWLIEGWLPDQTILFVIAAPGSYKTWLNLDLAVSVAGRRPFLGIYPVLRSGPVIIIQMEDPHAQVAQRLGVIVFERFGIEIPVSTDPDVFPFLVPPALPIHLHPDRGFSFDDDKAVSGLVATVERLRPVLVLVDPLYLTVDTTDFMAGSGRKMLFLKELRDQFRCSFVIAHHTRKGLVEGAPIRERTWGSQLLNAFLETGWQIHKLGRSSIKVQRHSKVSPPLPTVTVAFDIETKHPSHYRVSVQERGDADEQGSGGHEAYQTAICEYLVEYPGATQNAVVDAVTGANADIRNTLRQMVADGDVVMVPGKGGRHTHFLPENAP